ncbi:MAG: hypothetical protein Q4G67_08080 [Actinomycetia bacterium]|nr:hypothetical protein [Actinomycetes bacterium]
MAAPVDSAESARRPPPTMEHMVSWLVFAAAGVVMALVIVGVAALALVMSKRTSVSEEITEAHPQEHAAEDDWDDAEEPRDEESWSEPAPDSTWSQQTPGMDEDDR